MKYHCLLTLLAALVGNATAKSNDIDLSGVWRFALDAADAGIKAKPEQWQFPDTIQLPGMVSAQGFGETPSFNTQWTGTGWRYPNMFKEWQADGNFKFPFFLQPPKHYVGPAWYQRDIVIPEDWKGSEAVLHLERVHWQSTAWVDGRELGKGDSLGTPHEFNLGSLTPGKHVLTLRIDNRLGALNVGSLSHSVTDHTQGNWNGVVGKVQLRARSASHIDQIQVYPEQDGAVRIIATGTVAAEVHEGGIQIEVGSEMDPGKHIFMKYEAVQRGADGSFRVERAAKLANPRTWSEFDPAIYTAQVALSCGDDMPVDRKTVSFGFREVGTKDGRITINGHKTFLRGTLECCVFPLTGHPPTDVDSWKRIVSICKAHGLNHIRFHSWCPPEAAFVAADELGFYYQVEVSSWANGGAEIGSGRPLDAWLEAESKRMLAAYGNHPSFLLMAYGNEPAGANHPKWLQDWVVRRKQEDPRHLYTTAAGWPLMAGSDYHNMPQPRIQGWGQGMGSIINGQPPRTDFDWSGFVKQHPDAPVVSHEIGQWCVYPDFKEIGKYTGYFKPRNFEIFQETARRAGLLDQAHDFLMASGKLQALAYKHEIEAALRTPRFGGFQLLDLHDFPGQGTALVGVLNAFWGGKGYISPEEFSHFCGPVVPLARMKKLVFTTADSLEAEIDLAQFGPHDLTKLEPEWKLTGADGAIVAQGKLPVRDVAAGELHALGAIRVPLAKVVAPAKLVLAVGAVGQAFVNSWDLFVYPEGDVPANTVSIDHAATGIKKAAGRMPAPPVARASCPEPSITNPMAKLTGLPASAVPSGVQVTRDLEEAKSILAKGGKVLWLPPAAQVRNDLARPLVAGFSPIFWNTAWTNWQPPHTLGILCDPKHPALAAFPTDFHSNWQWWELQRNAQPFVLTDMRGLKPVVQVIDDWFTNRKLGYVFEAKVGKGRLLACAFDLAADLAKRPVARQMRRSLLEYLGSARFSPEVTLVAGALDGLVRPIAVVKKLGAKISASSVEPGYQAAAVLDGDPSTLWHTEYSARKPGPPHELTLSLPAEVVVRALVLTQRQDGNPNGQLAGVEILDANGTVLAAGKVPMGASGYRVPLPPGTRLKTCKLRVLASHGGPFASLAELDLER